MQRRNRRNATEREQSSFHQPEGKKHRLEVARRDVRKWEQRLRGQFALVARLGAHGYHTGHARRILKAHLDFLRIARDHLCLEEKQLRRKPT